MNSGEPTSQSPTYNSGVHRFCQFLTVWTFLVICLGGTVKSKEAGLAVPEPFLLEWVAGWWRAPNYAVEYAHRMFVGILGCAVAVLMVWVLQAERRKAVRQLAVWAVVAVFVQAAFGYLTVNYFTHWPTAVPHAALGQVFLCVMAILAAVTSPAWMGTGKSAASDESPTLRRLAVSNLIALFVQVLLGAALRHDDKGEPLRNGHTLVFLTHLTVHILGAFAVVFYMARLLMRVFRSHRQQPEILHPARAIMMLLGVQLVLGIGATVLKVLTSQTYEAANDPPTLRVLIATAHVAVGAAMLAYSAVLAVRAYRFTTVLIEQRGTGGLSASAVRSGEVTGGQAASATPITVAGASA